MTMSYRHTQSGIVMIAACLLAGTLSAAMAWPSGQWPASIVLIILMIAAAFLFSSLTVEIGEDELRWYFGPGFWTYRLPLTEIEDVAVVRNHWWNGFGIRMGAGRRLYNVSGLDAVELKVGPNDVRRIGTDDPQGLADALRSSKRRG
jgi:hypothetical protein